MFNVSVRYENLSAWGSLLNIHVADIDCSICLFINNYRNNCVKLYKGIEASLGTQLMVIRAEPSWVADRDLLIKSMSILICYY